MNMIIVGDILPQECNMNQFEKGVVSSLVSPGIQKILSDADCVVCNLEGPLTDDTTSIAKDGVCLKASTASVCGLSKLGIKYFSLANNHIMDYGEEGLQSTIDSLTSINASYFGVGKNKDEARRPLIITCGDVRVGLYSCAEHEFTIATSKRSGANLFDPLYVFDDITSLKNQVDYVVVLYHGSKEFYRFPVPYVQERCRKMIDKGASLVLCQHSHCIGTREAWGDGEILFGQGNFLFNRVDDEFRHSGLIVSVSFEKEKFHVNYIPVVRKNVGVSEPTDLEAKEIIAAFIKRSADSQSAEFVEEMYTKFAKSKLGYYNSIVLPDNMLIKVLKRLLGSRIIGRASMINKAKLLNLLRCEAHRDLFIRALVEENSFDNYNKRL